MTLHAVENITDAFAATREFLTPFSLSRWAKLALVVFFIGTGTSMPTPGFDASVPVDDVPDVDVTIPGDVLLVIGVFVVFVILLALLWALISSIMEFVFIESLRRKEVTLRRYWGRRWRQGVRLLGFRIALAIPMFALVIAWLALIVLPIVAGASPAGPLALFLLGLPLLFIVGLLFGVVYLFTTVFVVPIMIKTDSGVLAAWRQLWPSIKTEWKQYLGYAVIGGVLTFLAGLVVALVVGFAAVLLLIPLVGIAILVHLTVSITSTIGLVVLGTLVFLFIAAMIVIGAFVQVPVVAYLRYYALLVLGDIEPEFDLIPDQRAAVRDEPQPAGTSPA